MDGIKTYLLSVLVIAFVCSFINRLVSNRANSAVLKMITGLIVTMTVLQPLKGIYWGPSSPFSLDYKDQITDAIAKGETEKQKALTDIIRQEVVTYILRQAKMLHVDVTVDVVLTDAAMPVPEFVRISGNVAPYAKQQLINIIERELGVAEENQIWQ